MEGHTTFKYGEGNDLPACDAANPSQRKPIFRILINCPQCHKKLHDIIYENGIGEFPSWRFASIYIRLNFYWKIEGNERIFRGVCRLRWKYRFVLMSSLMKFSRSSLWIIVLSWKALPTIHVMTLKRLLKILPIKLRPFHIKYQFNKLNFTVREIQTASGLSKANDHKNRIDEHVEDWGVPAHVEELWSGQTRLL